MLCEKCGQREATSHFKQTINGKTTVYHVCAQCAEQMGLNNLFHGFHFNIGDMFGGLLGVSLPVRLLRWNEKCVQSATAI